MPYVMEDRETWGVKRDTIKNQKKDGEGLNKESRGDKTEREREG